MAKQGPLPYLDFIGSFKVGSYRVKESLGDPRVQADTYKIHYRGLYRQPRIYQAKIMYLGQNMSFQVLFRLYRPYIDDSYSIWESIGVTQGTT